MLEAKTNLVFLHGGPGFRDYLKPYFESLSDQFNCVFYDQVRGSQVSVSDMVNQLGAIVSALKGKTVLVGHSWGGALAFEYAFAYPKQISALVIISTGLCAQHWREEYYKELKDLGLENASMEDIFLTSDERDVGVKFLDECNQTFSQETFQNLQSYLRDYDVIPRLSQLSMPIINIFGEKDVRFPARSARNFPQYSRHIKNFEVEGAGHFPFLTTKRQFWVHETLRRELKDL